MLPPTHLAFTYLIWRRIPGVSLSWRGVAFLAFFALFPDFVDKPVYWGMELFHSGRTMSHNLFFVAAAWMIWATMRHSRRGFWWFTAAFGITLHVVGDVIQSFYSALVSPQSVLPGWYTFLLFPLYDPYLAKPRVDLFLFLPETLLTLVGLWFFFKDRKASGGAPFPKVIDRTQ